jgi:hypothetical protein
VSNETAVNFNGVLFRGQKQRANGTFKINAVGTDPILGDFVDHLEIMESNTGNAAR